MHTRRLAAFLVGGWLLGAVLVAFALSQSLINVDRLLTDLPARGDKETIAQGSDALWQILRAQALRHNRHILETWEAIQLGLGAALLATSILTSRRSRILVPGAMAMTLIVAAMHFYITPSMSPIAASLDFLPAGAEPQAREELNQYLVWRRVLEILKNLVAIVIAVRLLFDRYEWGERIASLPVASSPANRRHSTRPRNEPKPQARPEVDSDQRDSDV